MKSKTDNITTVEVLYNELIKNWNDRNAKGFSNCFSSDALSIGFDGSEARGKEEIFKHLDEVFNHHQTSAYVTIIREVKFISDEVSILRAFVGMIPPGDKDINPAVNAIQTLVTRKENGTWLIEQLQNTPAAYHMRPDLSEKLTKYLRTRISQISTD